jgi:hypothetical protein
VTAARLALLLVAVLLAVGCGSTGTKTDTQPLVQPTPRATGTLSEQSRLNAAIQEMNLVRDAGNNNKAGKAILAIVALLNRASALADRDVGKSAALLRTKVPVLVQNYAQGYPLARHNVEQLQLTTALGRADRTLMLYLLDENLRLYKGLSTDVQRSPSAWEAIVRYADKENAFVRDANRRFHRMIVSLPASQRGAVNQAVSELYGVSP